MSLFLFFYKFSKKPIDLIFKMTYNSIIEAMFLVPSILINGYTEMLSSIPIKIIILNNEFEN